MKRRRKRQRKIPPKKPAALPVTSIILEEIDLVNSSSESEPEDVAPVPPVVVDLEEETGSEVNSVSGTMKQHPVHLSDSDPHLISMLVKHHCIFCLQPKDRIIYSILKDNLEESDGYELLRRYFGVRTADCLNDVFDATVFTNKALLTSEFPAPLLCESCVGIVGELEVLHRKLEGIQRQILKRVKGIRALVLENGTGEEANERRLEFEVDLLDDCGGREEVVEVAMRVLNKFQVTLEEETHDKIEIHLEHLDIIDSFEVEEDEVTFAPRRVSKQACEVGTQTDNTEGTTVTMTNYSVKIVRVEMDEEDEQPEDGISDHCGKDIGVLEHAGSSVEVMEEEEEKPIVEVKQEVLELDSTGQAEDKTLENVVNVSTELEPAADDANLNLNEQFDKKNPMEMENVEKNITPEVTHWQNGEDDNGDDSLVEEFSDVPEDEPEPVSEAGVEVDTTEKEPQRPELRPPPEVPESSLPVPVAMSTPGIMLPPENPTISTSSTPVVMQRNANGAISIQRIKDNHSKQNSPQEEQDDVIILEEKKAKKRKIEEDDESEEEDDSDTDTDSSSEESSTSSSSEEDSQSPENSPNKSKPFRCGLCRHPFWHRSDVHRHIRRIHHTEPYSTSQSHSVPSISCMECNFECGELKVLRHHMNTTHGKSLSKKALNCHTYKCHTCGYTKDGLFRLPTFLEHLLEHESCKKVVTCEDCHQSFTTKQMYQMHPCPQVGRPPLPHEGPINPEAALEYFRQLSEFRCRLCPEVKLLSEKDLQQHFSWKHKETLPFPCEHCPEQCFSSTNSLKTHLIDVHNGVKYKCRICCGELPVQFSKWDELQIHWNKEHFEGHFRCPECYKRFSERDQLDQHLKTHETNINSEEPLENEKEAKANNASKAYTFVGTAKSQSFKRQRRNGEAKPFSCTICDFACCTMKAFRIHMQIDHGIVIERKQRCRTYQCDICGFSSSGIKIKSFMQHLAEHETSKKSFHCEDCLAGFSTKQMYQVHKCEQTAKLPGTATVKDSGGGGSKRKSALIGPSKVEIYKCRFCDTEFPSEKRVQKHCLAEHGGSNAFVCPEKCGDLVTFSNKNNLNSHLITEHGAVPYKCRMCSPIKEFTTAHEVFLHLNLEHFGNYYECPQCPKRFVEKQRMENHLVSHGILDRSTVCPHCGKVLMGTKGLNKHILLMHTEGLKKKPMCEYCGKEFSEARNLKAHIQRIHLGNRKRKKAGKAEQETINQSD